MTARIGADLAVLAGDLIAEAPVWDPAGQRLLWVDHGGDAVRRAAWVEPPGDEAASWRLERSWNTGRHIGAVAPRAAGGLVVAAGLDLLALDEDGTFTPLATAPGDPAQVRLGDSKCDRAGRLWTGSYSPVLSTEQSGLYRIDADLSVHPVLRGTRLANGMGWSPDDRTFYFVDSASLGVDAFDFDLGTGAIGARRRLLTVEPGVGAPNGLAVDDEGCLWVALTGGGEVRRYGPDGGLLARVDLPVPGVTSCAFAGPSGEQLLITTRGGRLPPFARDLGVPERNLETRHPQAGGLFACVPGVTGSPPPPFAG